MKNDNAGGGLRGLRAKPSAGLLEAVRRCYGIEGIDDTIDLGGSSNLNLLVDDNTGRYVVRVYRPYVTASRLADIQLVRRQLKGFGVPISEALTTLDGKPWMIFDGRQVEVEHYVERDADMDSWERLKTGLPLLGRIHSILQDVKVSKEGSCPLFANHIEPQDAISRTMQGVLRIRGWDPTPDELRLADAAEELAHLIFTTEWNVAPALPRQLVHGDFWDNNVFFRDGRVALVTDFDYMGERARIDDLALTLYFANCQYPDDPVSDERIVRLRSLVDAYDQGLDKRLSREERAALPLAIARQPLWSIGGWIALLDDEEAARRHAAGMLWEVEWALRILRDLNKWQEAFM
jgi:Ser/Thr protein kinase RdoA (MazF antagonist)